MLGDCDVKVAPAEARVVCGALDDGLRGEELGDRDGGPRVPHVHEHHFARLLLVEVRLVEAVVQRGRGVLGQQAHDVQPGDACGGDERAPLALAPEPRDAHHDVAARRLVRLHGGFQLPENHRCNLHGGEHLGLAEVVHREADPVVGGLANAAPRLGDLALHEVVGEAASDEPLDVHHGVPQVAEARRGCRLADKALLVAEGHHVRCLAVARLVGDDVDALLAGDRHHTVCCSAVNANGRH